MRLLWRGMYRHCAWPTHDASTHKLKFSCMNILFITNMYPTPVNPVGGIFVKEQVDDISKALRRTFDVFLINAKYKGNLQYLLSIIRIPALLRKNRYDIIHIHYGFSGLFLLFFRPRARIFLTLHGADIMRQQKKYIQIWVTKRVIRKVDKVYILNKEMEDVVKPLNPNYEMLPCGVNVDFFTPAENERPPSDTKTIIFSNDPKRTVKNFPLFEKTIELLRKRSKFTIEYRCIHKLSREEVRHLYNNADCLLMTSISEGSPQVVKEALSCNLPVVSVPVGDVSVITDNVPHCYVSKTHDAGELCDLVLEALEADMHGPHVIRKALIEKNTYDNHSITQRLLHNYTSTMKENPLEKKHRKNLHQVVDIV